MALTKEQMEDVLDTIAECGLIHETCEKVGVDYQALGKLRLHDKVFSAAFDEARRKHGEKWERATRTRGIEGWDEPVYGQKDGEHQQVGVKRRYSDRCLEMGLKRFCPEYREKMQIDATISGGVLVVGSKLTEDEWRAKYEKGDDDA